jgi:glycosyltransferase involved in cell wall biosynthesis
MWEVFIVENGSTDSTWDKLKNVTATNLNFKVIKLSRNFRMDGGLTAGLEYIKGDACVLMTADLQDPPEMISEFLRKWEEGYENIYSIGDVCISLEDPKFPKGHPQIAQPAMQQGVLLASNFKNKSLYGFF